MFAYIGCRTSRERNAQGEGLSVYQFKPKTGKLSLIQLLKDLINPSYLCLNAKGDRLYVVHGDTTMISAYRVDQHTGTISALNHQDTEGKNPVHLALDPSEQYMVVSNHIGQSMAVFPILTDGSLGPVSQLLKIDGEPGPHRIEQKHAKPHHNPFSPDGNYILVPDKGLDKIFSFKLQNGTLASVQEPVQTREGAGPRHIAFHPTQGFAYCINELDSSVTTYRYDRATGQLQALQILPSLPATYTASSRAAAIIINPQGTHIYCTNRGHDSIAIFTIHPETGLLSYIDHQLTQGKTPRFITLSPDGHYLFALNEESHTIRVFQVDSSTGKLHDTGEEYITGSPVCMIFSR